MSQMTKTEVIDLIYQALRKSPDKRIDDVTYDGDHNSGEIALTVGEGSDQVVWMIKSDDLVPTDPDEDA